MANKGEEGQIDGNWKAARGKKKPWWHEIRGLSYRQKKKKKKKKTGSKHS